MPTGFLKVQTLTSRAELPVRGAVVTVSRVGAGGRRELLSLQRTDESGMTELISIPTPERSNSLTPDLPQGWTNVQVAASQPDFDGVVSRDVQIFPGITTVQTLYLVPRGGMPTDRGETEDYSTPPQDL